MCKCLPSCSHARLNTNTHYSHSHKSVYSQAESLPLQAEMSNFHKLQDDLEAVIVKDAESASPPDSGDQSPRHPDGSFRGKLDSVIHSQKFQVAIIALVVLDCLVVVVELLVEHQVFGEEVHHHPAAKALHYLSLSILSIFIVEILARLYVLRLDFFKHKFELFDAVVVLVSFVLDIVFHDSEGSTSGLGLLILLRLWRALRVMNSECRWTVRVGRWMWESSEGVDLILLGNGSSSTSPSTLFFTISCNMILLKVLLAGRQDLFYSLQEKD